MNFDIVKMLEIVSISKSAVNIKITSICDKMNFPEIDSR